MLVNRNTEDTNVILGKESDVLYGPGYIEDVLCGKRFRIFSDYDQQFLTMHPARLFDGMTFAQLKRMQIDIETRTGTMEESESGYRWKHTYAFI